MNTLFSLSYSSFNSRAPGSLIHCYFLSDPKVGTNKWVCNANKPLKSSTPVQEVNKVLQGFGKLMTRSHAFKVRSGLLSVGGLNHDHAFGVIPQESGRSTCHALA